MPPRATVGERFWLGCHELGFEGGKKGMLRDVTEEDLPIFFEHQRDPEAHRMAAFPPREREVFMLHWRTKVIGDPTARKRTIMVGDCVAGNIGKTGAAAST